MKLSIALIIQIQLYSFILADNFDLNSNDVLIAAKRNKRHHRPRSKCMLPPITPDKSYYVKFSHNGTAVETMPGQEVLENAIIVSQCNKGYVVDYENDDAFAELLSLCTRNSWQPPVLKCTRICKNFSSFTNYNMTCFQYFGGPIIPCNGLLLEGAIVKLECRQKFHRNVNVDYEYATCTDGYWDKEFFKCIPDCGAAVSNSISLIADGEQEKRGGAPWNLAIYDAERSNEIPKFICGATLISAELAISAAHCFYDELFHQKKDIEYFYVTVGKVSAEFNKVDYPTTKTYRLRNIYYPDITFEGALTDYVADIVILQLSEKVTYSLDVFPACLYMDDRERFNPGENVTGKLSGIGATADRSFPSVLYTANLPYISHSECKKRVGYDFRYSIPTDKFCAGSEKGSGAGRGDSGGGLLFRDNMTGLYYLRGVVSIKDSSSDSYIASFTDVAQYISWIAKTIENIERESKLCGCNSNGTISSCDLKTVKCQCKAYVTGKFCDTCNDGYWQLSENNPNGCRACGCNSEGSYNSVCDKINGFCQCKPNVVGRHCDRCAYNTVWGSNGCEEEPRWVKYSHGERCSNAVLVHNETLMNDTSIIAKHQFNESLVMEDSSPAQRFAVVPWFETKSQFSEYEVLCGGYVEWVPMHFGGAPRTAVVSRIDGDIPVYIPLNFTYVRFPRQIYVCRALAGNDSSILIPGELQSPGSCHISYEDEEVERYDYEVLVQFNATACECNSVGSLGPACEGIVQSCKCKPNVIGKNCDRCAPDTYDFGPKGCKEGPKWLEFSNGTICSNAVVAAKQASTNKTWFLTRYRKDNYYKFAAATLNFVSWLGAEKLQLSGLNLENQPSTYEVLCGGSTKWIDMRNPGRCQQSFVGLRSYGTKGVQNVYVCKVDDDDMPLGVMFNEGFCETCEVDADGNESEYEYIHFDLMQVL